MKLMASHMTEEIKRNNDFVFSPTRRKRLETQGYDEFTDRELNDVKFGIRFAYCVCTTLIVVGLLLTNLKILSIAMAVAFLGTTPPSHPFDYLYNYIIKHFMHKPKMPPRSNEGRFACGIASIWLGGVIFLFYNDLHFWGYLAGGLLVVEAMLVSTMDFCIPSMIYNFLFKRKMGST